MVVHGGKVTQLAVRKGKVLKRCNSWGQKIVSPNFFFFLKKKRKRENKRKKEYMHAFI
jgi:hypothetical protein